MYWWDIIGLSLALVRGVALFETTYLDARYLLT